MTLFIGLWGCESSTEPVTEGTLSLSSSYSVAPAPAARVIGSAGPVAEITITRARFVLRDIKYKSATEDSLTFKAAPFVLQLDLTGASQTVSSIPVKFGSYRRIEFDVHRVEQPEIDALPAAEQVQFGEFLADEKYSSIIERTYTPTGGSAVSFTYRSKVDAKQKVDLNPELVIAEGSTEVNTTMLISSEGWFKDSSGSIVDPTDTNNEGIIDENLKASIRVFKDNNKDGSKDS
jgi:hypothetical protein